MGSVRRAAPRIDPAYTFQAVLCWLDTGDADYAASALAWTGQSGLWQTRPDINRVAGGWIDWQEVTPSPGTQAPTWQRFIDTSFYSIAACNGGYDFSVAAPNAAGEDPSEQPCTQMVPLPSPPLGRPS